MASSDFGGKWDELEADGYHAGRFRVLPDGVLDLFIGYSRAGEREFSLESDQLKLQIIELPTFENIALSKNIHGSVSSLVLRLTDKSLAELFTIICSDLANASSLAKTVPGAMQVFETRLSRWSRLLKRRAGSGMSFAEQLGLLGELTTLVWMIEDVGLAPELCILGWRGADGDDTDIGVNNVKIEVKAQLATQAPALKISSLEQLSIDDKALFLLHSQFSSSDDGISLRSLVEKIEFLLELKAAALADFKRKLLLVSYDHAAPYASNEYVINSRQPYRVTNRFPRLTRETVPFGITNVRYEIACSSVGDHRCDLQEIARMINGSP